LAVADAVLSQRLLIGGAALGLLFLIVLALVGAFAGLAFFVDRYRQADAQVERILTETLTTRPAPADDTRELAAGCDRLKAAIRNQQQKGETQ
jgi:hypothetical protein